MSIRYEFRIRGVLSAGELGAFPELDAVTRHGETMLSGTLADQAALFSVLSQIEALALELLEVRASGLADEELPSTPRRGSYHCRARDEGPKRPSSRARATASLRVWTSSLA